MAEIIEPRQINEVEILDTESRMFKAWGSVEVRDRENDLLPMDEFRKIMPVIIKRGGILMDRHSNRQVGKILNYEFKDKQTDEGKREGVMITGEIFKDYEHDDMVWQGIKDGVYKGLSFGGRNQMKDVKFDKNGLTNILSKLEGFEFSLVPGMGNQEATMEEINYLAKSNKFINKRDLDKSMLNQIEKIEDELNILKGKVFLKPGEEPPKGASVQTGPRGGKFFISGGRREGEKPQGKKPTGDKPTEDKPSGKFSQEEITDFRRDGVDQKAKVKYQGKTFFITPIFSDDPEEVGDTKIPIGNEINGSRVKVVSISELFPPDDFEKSLSKNYLSLSKDSDTTEKYIKENDLNKSMEESELNNIQKNSEAIERIEKKLDSLIKGKEEDEDKEDEKGAGMKNMAKDEKPDKEEVPEEKDDELEKEGAKKVQLPQVPEEETGSGEPAQDEEDDKVKFVEKSEFEEVKKELASLVNKGAKTPRPSLITKTQSMIPKTQKDVAKLIQELR